MNEEPCLVFSVFALQVAYVFLFLLFSVCLLLVVAGLFFLYCFGLFTSKPYTNVLRWLLLISFALLLHKNEEPCYIQCVSSLVCLIPMCRDTFFFLIHSIFGC